ncbi:MAG: SCO family protein, partial [Acidobacteriota bacterium]
MRRLGSIVLLGLASLCLAQTLAAQTQTMAAPRLNPGEYKPIAELPEAVKELGFDQKLGAQVSLDEKFVDANGDEIALGSLFGERPVLLAPVYFECPMLCSLVLDGVVRGIKPLQFSPGTEFDVIALSFDHEESYETAAFMKDGMLSRYRREGTEGGWHFLTGTEESIAKVMDEVGFKYEYNEQTDLWGHAGGVVLLTPDGRVSRYFYGVDYAPKDLRLGLIEASEGQIGS